MRLPAVITSLTSLDKRLQSWSGRAAGLYKIIELEVLDVSSPNTPHPLQASMPVHLYSSPSMASFWNQYRCMRILLLQCLRRCLSQQETGNASNSQTLSITIGVHTPAASELPELINGIFASVPYLLGEVDQDGSLKMHQQKKAVGGLFLLWPLRLLLYMNLINPGQRRWILERLAYIRNVLGIQAAAD